VRRTKSAPGSQRNLVKHTQNVTYAEACKQCSKTQVGASIPLHHPRVNNPNFRPLPLNSSCSRNMDIDHRHPVNISCDHTTLSADKLSKRPYVRQSRAVSGVLSGRHQTISAKPIDLFKIITDAAGGRLGLPVEAHQLKALFSNCGPSFTMDLPTNL